ncbi:MAG: acyl-CoA carboxylase subunit epsilon [Bifidobacteriaceae bacterium]|nr:acyl-CoA carboxylase subunit epsilon [Bifidobacteriaceae bacterium]
MTPALTIVRGAATPEELAALTVSLAALAFPGFQPAADAALTSAADAARPPAAPPAASARPARATGAGRTARSNWSRPQSASWKHATCFGLLPAA